MGAERRRGAIVLVVFGQVGIRIGELRNFEISDVVEEKHWLDYGVYLFYQDLLHRFQFADVSRKVWRDGQSRGQVSGQHVIF